MTTPCAQQPDLWFSEDRHNIKAAKAICADCPVRLECLKVALDANEQHGVWGGLDAVERARMTTTTPGEKVCALDECTTLLPVEGKRGNRRYCSLRHTAIGSSRAYKARQVAS